MNLRQIYEYYSREDIKNFIVNFSKDREVTGVFRSGGFSKRPNVILYPNDVTAMVKTGIVEFHGSLEHWSRPMNLKSNNYDELRIGWDLVLDLDCKVFEHGKVASEAFLWALEKHGIKGASIKFTGGTGFHLGIPWESFPENVDYKPMNNQYPETARRIVRYLKDFTREKFEKDILRHFSAEELSSQVEKPLGKILTEDGINPYEIVDVDPILLSPRHFFRLPYSLNRKTYLVSVPIDRDDLKNFKKEKAMPEKIRILRGFLDKKQKEEASTLVMEASDWWERKSQSEKDDIMDNEWKNMRRMGFMVERDEVKMFKRPSTRKEFTSIVPEKLFPPCIKNISLGLSDGRKRSVFTLINFLRSSNWNWEDIEKYLIKWNLRNKPPLRENTIRSNLRWQKSRNKQIPPPNCFRDDDKSDGYYIDFSVCKPDSRCSKIKNPVTYPRGMMKKSEKKKKKAKRNS